MAVRSRGLALTSPPPMRAATVISLIRRVKIFPRLASAAPFLCLMVDHLLCPDITASCFLPIPIMKISLLALRLLWGLRIFIWVKADLTASAKGLNSSP